MDSIEKQQRKREARHRLLAQRRRAGLLRSRVIAISLISFALLWGAVFVQMATGNDPVLGDPSSTANAANGHLHAARQRAAEVRESEVEFLEEEAAVEPAEEEFFEEEPAPVTTSQS